MIIYHMVFLTGIPLQMLTAFVVDICVGDPRWFPHPVIYIGRLIEFLERQMRRPSRPPLYNIVTGALATSITVAVTYWAAHLFTGVLMLPLRQYTIFNSISLYDLTIGITGSLVLAQNGLIRSVLLVRDKLDGADEDGARTAVAMIVGRDTKALTQEGIARAAIETAAENTSDAVIAPLFYFAVGGLPLALAYKAVNTLDSMIGYKNERYIYFGRAAAKLDDVANYIPARLTGIVMVLAVFAISIVKLLRSTIGGNPMMPRMNEAAGHTDVGGQRSALAPFTHSLTTMLRDGRNHSSLNAGIPEAAMAGALGIRLGGPSYYGGTLVEKPYIGSADEPVSVFKITDAAAITAVSSFVGLLVLIVLLFGAAVAAADNQTISGNIFTETGNQFTVLLVDKHTSQLHVAEIKDNMPHITKNYGALYGRNNGDKLKEGDNKTPEGFYYITNYIPPEHLDRTLYGCGAYTLNYPNIMDKNKGKTGSGIWIHGRGAERNNEKTQGCVTLSNNDFSNLKAYNLMGAPVIISGSLEFLSAEEYKKRKNKYMDIFKGFIRSWEKGDFEGFANYFDTSFRGYGGLSAQSYLNKKKQLMKTIPKRRVIVSNVNIFKEDTSKLMYSFDQLYCADNLLSYGSKRLYLTAEKEDDYRIVAEEFTQLEMEPFIEKDVISIVNKWKAVWQAKDIEKYISFYSSSFMSDTMDIKQWKAHKKGIFKNSKSIKVKLTEMKLKTVSPRKVVVSFMQEYTAGDVADRGIKTLVLSGCPGDYKIVGEEWNPA